MAKSFIGKGYAHQSKIRAQKRWAKLSAEERRRRSVKAAIRRDNHTALMHDLLK